MADAIALDPDLRRFHEALAELYGPALDRVVLFGSRARGDAGPESDYDVAVFLTEKAPGMAERFRLAALTQRFLDSGGPFFEAIPFLASDYDKRTMLMHEIRPRRHHAVKPETEEMIAYARKLLADAGTMMGANMPDHAARTAYLACFHVARAYSFERGVRTGKTHRGVRTEFSRLTKDDTRVDPELRAFLATAYTFKGLSDYSTGPEDTPTPAEALQAVKTARRFVTAFAALTPLDE